MRDRRLETDTVEGRIFQNIKALIRLRQKYPVFAGSDMRLIDTNSTTVLGYLRTHHSHRALVFANFSETPQTIPANLLRLYGLSYSFTNLLNQERIPFQDLPLDPYQFICLTA